MEQKMRNPSAAIVKPKPESPDIGMTAAERKEVADALIDILADTFMLQVKTQVFHWNVVGPTFFSLHKLTEEHYTNLFSAVDKLAERVRSLGYLAPINLVRLVEESAISNEKSLKDVAGMLNQLVVDHEKLTQRARVAAKVAEETDDFASHDLLVARLTFHETAIWMLRALAV